jgi:hypothetical protein
LGVEAAPRTPQKAKTPTSLLAVGRKITILPSTTYTPEVTICQGPELVQ